MRVKFLWILVALLLVAGCTPIQAPTAAPTASNEQLPLTTYQLANGLQVILVEKHSAPTVAVNVWCRVGGMNDPEQRSGFAHLFEHMMFQGSANAPKGEMDRLDESVGGSNNASTHIEYTNYYQVMPANQLPLALWLDADRMASLDVNQANLDNQRDVVIEEYHQRVSNSPYGEAFENITTLPYDYAPYRKRVIGSVEDLRRASLDDVIQFHNTYYAPNNATLVVAGDINVTQTRKLVQDLFGSIPVKPTPPPPPAYTPAPRQEAQAITMTDNLAKVPAVLIGYSAPPRNDPDYPAVDLLANILGSGNSSRLAKLLMDTGEAVQASTFLDGNRGPSLFAAILVPNGTSNMGALTQKYDEEIARISKEGVNQAELDKAINLLRSGRIVGLEQAQELAEAVQAANFYLGDPKAVFTELDAYRKVTPADIQRVAAKYLAPERRTIINVQPGAESQTAAPASSAAVTETAAATETAPVTTTGAVTRTSAASETVPVTQTGSVTQTGAVTPTAPVTSSQAATATASVSTTAQPTSTFVLTQTTPPPALPSTALTLPNIQEKKLDNGLSVIVIERPELPILSVDLYLPGGESAAPAGKTGLADLTANTLTRGTKTRSAQQIAETIEQVGGTIGANATNDALSVGVFALKENTELAFALLGDVALNPTFPAQEVKIQQENQLTNLQDSMADPGTVAQRAFASIVYGQHPYGQLPTAQSIQGFTQQDVADFYASQIDPERAFLIVAGDINVELAAQLAQTAFGNWSPMSAHKPVVYPKAPEQTKQQIYLINRPGSSQAQLLIGNIASAGNDPQRYAQAVMNDILGGGGLTSRLMLNIREKLGYTYGISSSFSRPADRGVFRISSSVRNDVVDKALTAILGEVKQLQDKGVTADELNAKKTGLIGSFAVGLETYQSFVDTLASYRLRNVPLSALANYPKAIEQVSASDVQTAAQQFIQPAKWVIVVVGDASVIQKQLETVAPVEVIEAR
ncbi:MAG: insulinase family protein [Caldilineaceae bacterium]